MGRDNQSNEEKRDILMWKQYSEESPDILSRNIWLDKLLESVGLGSKRDNR